MIYAQLFTKPICSYVKYSHIRNYSKHIRNLLCERKVSRFGLSFKYSSNQYSTVINYKFQRCHIRDLCAILPTQYHISHLSTNTNEEKYQVVFTNPAEQTFVSKEISLNASENTPIFTTDSPLSSTESLNVVSLGETNTTSTEFLSGTDNLISEFPSAIAAVEPSLTEFGLASNWTPVGWVQQWLEYLHIGWDMPWWMAIITTTVIARILLTPLLIKTQKNALLLSNYMPQLQYLQAKFGEARRAGNSMEASRYANEIVIYMKEHNINPLKNAALPLLQAPVFISFFLGLRGMARAPVPTMTTGGLSWTYDLTVPDPYYVLPVIACGTLYVILKVGAESGIKMDNLKLAKYAVRALPIVALPFCINFPSAILYYWCTNNLCTLLVVSILKIEPVRQYLKLPKQNPVDPKFSTQKTGLIKGIKEAYEDQKVLGMVEDRRRMDDMRFQKAGTGPVPRTYAYDPTKPRPTAAKGRKV